MLVYKNNLLYERVVDKNTSTVYDRIVGAEDTKVKDNNFLRQIISKDSLSMDMINLIADKEQLKLIQEHMPKEVYKVGFMTSMVGVDKDWTIKEQPVTKYRIEAIHMQPEHVTVDRVKWCENRVVFLLTRFINDDHDEEVTLLGSADRLLTEQVLHEINSNSVKYLFNDLLNSNNTNIQTIKDYEKVFKIIGNG